MQVLIYTCDRYHWCLPPYAYLHNVYWSEQQPVVVAGGEPDVPLPPNFSWLPVESRVAERWSDGLIEALRLIEQPFICWLLEDYWLVRYVAWDILGSLEEYMALHPDVLKIDLTADRLHSGRAVDVDCFGRTDLIETSWEGSYQFSTQAAIWNREHLLGCLRREMSPWDFELQDKRPEHLRVLGTRNWPLRYINGVGMGLDKKYRYRTEHIRDGLGGRTIERIDPEHVARMRELGILPPQEVES